MKNSKRIILRALPVLFMLVAMVFVAGGSIFAEIIDTDIDIGDVGGISSVDTMAKKTWATVKLILQILAVAAIILAGVRYMFASADAKADIKKQTVILVVGAIIVFGASSLVDVILQIFQDVTGK